MLDRKDILKTQNMIDKQHLDIRTITMGISLLDCSDPDLQVCCEKIYNKITRCAKNLVKTGETIEKDLAPQQNGQYVILPSTSSPPENDPTTNPDDPTTDPDDPTTDPDDPTTDPDDPTTDPDDPTTDPDEPTTDPDEPTTEPSNDSSEGQGTEPSTDSNT